MANVDVRLARPATQEERKMRFEIGILAMQLKLAIRALKYLAQTQDGEASQALAVRALAQIQHINEQRSGVNS